ncbi:Ycf20-like protein [Ananas comosus]|uniref:Ycf20-like protein n=1 Tax=Ananas comosus TaxID=4615 RepID=A0A199VC07_ANACO|nr:Ycf20-like protein [Ananas comosus]
MRRHPLRGPRCAPCPNLHGGGGGGGGALRRSPAHGEMFLGNDDKDAISTILQREHLVAIVKMPESEVYDESMPSRQHSPMQKEVFSESSLLLRARWALKSMADSSKSEASENAESSANSGTRLVGAIQSFQTKLKRRIEVLRRGLSVKILFFLVGFYCATAFATVIGQTGDWDILSAGLAVVVVEGIGALMYRGSLPFIDKIRSFITLFNYWKAGLSLGLFLDAFKYEADLIFESCKPFDFEIHIFPEFW